MIRALIFEGYVGTNQPFAKKSDEREIIEKYEGWEYVYNPAADRQVRFYASATPLRAIKQGEELFDNYLAMCGKSAAYWEHCVNDLRKQCEGRGVGSVTEYERY